MFENNQKFNKQNIKEFAKNYRQYSKEIGMGIMFVIWLSYSAFALGLNILTAPSGLQCTHQIAN